jgi:hypothetical protein
MSTLRGPGPVRSLRQAIEDRNAKFSRTEVLEDEPYKQALEQLLPQIAAESEQAAKPARVPFLYYRKKRMGRRCSCFHIETSPDANCQICFGCGYVGGWDLHGCRSEWIDVTQENLRLVNLQADTQAGTRPVYFTMEDGTNRSFLELDLEIVRNIKKTQCLQIAVGNKRRGASVDAFVKASGDLNFVPLTEANLDARLNESKLSFRIELNRNNTTVESPRLSHVLIRYQLVPEIRMYGDMNLGDNAFELGDLGFFDSFSTLNVYVPPSFDQINNEDFLIRQSDQKRFKVTRFQRNAPLEVLTSHMVTARLLIPGTDSLIYFP